jgi:hypothetical protein
MRTEAITQTTTANRTKKTRRASMENMIGGPPLIRLCPSDRAVQSMLGVVTIEAA